MVCGLWISQARPTRWNQIKHVPLDKWTEQMKKKRKFSSQLFSLSFFSRTGWSHVRPCISPHWIYSMPGVKLCMCRITVKYVFFLPKAAWTTCFAMQWSVVIWHWSSKTNIIEKYPRKIILAIIISLLIDVGLLKTNVVLRWGFSIIRDNSVCTCCSETWNKQVGEKQTHPHHAAVACFHSSESRCAQACFKTVFHDKYTKKAIWQKC